MKHSRCTSQMKNRHVGRGAKKNLREDIKVTLNAWRNLLLMMLYTKGLMQVEM